MTAQRPRLKRPVIMHFPENRLEKLVNRPGGMWRDAAIGGAQAELDALRESFVEIVETLVSQLEAAAAGKEEQRLANILRLSNQIINIAGCFEMTHLADATKRLSDLVSAFRRRKMVSDNAIDVHVRAIRLFSPSSETLGDAEAAIVLGQLRRVLAHFEIDVPAEPSDDMPDLENAGAEKDEADPAPEDALSVPES